MTPLRDRLVAAFRDEAREYLGGMRDALARLGGPTPVDPGEAFRQAHSLRAAARACDFTAVENVGQRLEGFFDRLRKGGYRPAPGAVGAARAVIDALDAWTETLTGGATAEPQVPLAALDAALEAPPTPAPAPKAPDDLTAKLRAAFEIEHREHLEGIRGILATLDSGPLAPGFIDEAFRRAHSLKGAARIAELRTVEALAHRLETLFARVREKALALDPDVARAIHLGLDAIEDAADPSAQRPTHDSAQALDAIERVLRAPTAGIAPEPPAVRREPAPEHAPPPPKAAPVPAAETVRVGAEHLDRLLASVAQLQTELLHDDVIGRQLTDLERQLGGLEREWTTARETAADELRHLADTAPRVARYVAALERRLGDLVRTARGARRSHRRGVWVAKQLGGQLQSDARLVRTVTAESVFQGFGKTVRDLAREEGKEVEFVAAGLDAKADRAVLQALKDPLMHALFNAVTHGIERPDDRRAKNKPAAGRVVLRLEVVGSRLRVTVEDDGRGIDPHAVGSAAVARGLLTEAEAAALPAADLARLVFRPGLTTARAVTGVAGRGMGLSVVHETALRLLGDADVGPGDGAGTRIVLSVPLTVSAQRLLLVACRGQTFALPVHAVERLLRVRAQELESVEGRSMVLIDGRPIPVAALARLLDLPGDDSPNGGPIPLAVLRVGTRRVAVAVDALVAERDAVVKPLDEPAARVARFAGGLLLDDGAVALVLNPAELLAGGAPQTAAPRAAERTPQVLPTILVVDDSMTTRTLEKSILEAHGYTVRTAVDGREALAALRAHPAALVVTDVQMPHLDGFGLLEEMRKDAKLARVPVIVVTSMDRREDRERGLALGANAYIVKRKFDHEDLLATVRQLL